MISVPYYGLHRAEGNVAFLMQDNGGQNALGMPLACPFVVKPTVVRMKCNHNMVPEKGPSAPFDDPLIEVMKPVPNPSVVYVREGKNPITMHMTLSYLCHMSSFTMMPILPIWAAHETLVRRELSITNVQPFVITGVLPTHRAYVDSMIALSILKPRRLVLVGSNEMFLPSYIPVIETKLTPEQVAPFNWTAIGNNFIYNEMLHVRNM